MPDSGGCERATAARLTSSAAAHCAAKTAEYFVCCHQLAAGRQHQVWDLQGVAQCTQFVWREQGGQAGLAGWQPLGVTHNSPGYSLPPTNQSAHLGQVLLPQHATNTKNAQHSFICERRRTGVGVQFYISPSRHDGMVGLGAAPVWSRHAWTASAPSLSAAASMC